MKPGFVERLEVLARRAPEYYVKAYERTVFVSPAKTAPAYAPWPSDVLSRSRVHANVVGYIAAAHYSGLSIVLSSSLPARASSCRAAARCR